MIDIVQVTDKRSLDRFIRVPWSIYQQDPCWIPPLIAERRHHLSQHNPFFEHAEGRYWVAFRQGTPVGRISAQVDRLYLTHQRDQTGFFGFIEAEDCHDTFAALLGTAAEWLRSMGMKRMRGPFSLSINDECGVLVEGFDTPPSVMMGHARPYYGSRLEASGLTPAKDLFAYRISSHVEPSPAMKRLASSANERITIRTLRKASLAAELEILRDIFNDAWSENWGFLPITAQEFTDLGKTLRFLVPEQLVQIAEVDGIPAAMIVLLPNFNELIRDLNGRLLPLGWLRLLWRIKMSGVRSGRIPLMGVRKKYQYNLMGSALAYLIIGAVQQQGVLHGIQEAEMSWVMEDNTRMRKMIEAAGGDPYKRYRLYETPLA